MTSTRQSPSPFAVQLLMLDGDPTGAKTVEKSNWSGCGVVIPRTLFPKYRDRPELARAGVYVLIGPDDETDLDRVYVGEGDPVKPRLDQHARHKDFWTHAAIFSSNGQRLNKAHVKHLESRLIAMAHAAKRCVLDNSNTSQAPSLSEANVAEVDAFLADVLLCMPVIGYQFFEQPPAPEPATQKLELRAKGITARGYEAPNGFVVTAGSGAVSDEVPSIHSHLADLRRSLIDQGVLFDADGQLEFVQDYEFGSPSTAAGVVLGRSANGRIEWSSASGQTLKSIQDAAVDA